MSNTDMTHPLDPHYVGRSERTCDWYMGPMDPKFKVEAREIFPELPEGFSYHNVISPRHGSAPIVLSDSSELPDDSVVKEICTILRSKIVVFHCPGRADDFGIVYRSDENVSTGKDEIKGPFPEEFGD